MVDPSKPVPAPPPLPLAPRKVIPLPEARFQQREFLQNEYSIDAPKGTALEDLLSRDFWAHVAKKLRRRDKITCMTDDCRMYVELVVFAVGANWAEVRVFGEPIIVGAEVTNSSAATDFVVEDGGLHLMWCIRRVSDGRLVKGDGSLKSRDAADAWLRDYLTANGLRRAA